MSDFNHLRIYLDRVHPTLPMLASTQSILVHYWRKCQLSGGQRLVLALQDALGLMKVNSMNDNSSVSAQSNIVDTLFSSARQHPKDRSSAENLTFLWLCCLAHVLYQEDISRQKQIDKHRLLQIAIDVCLFLIQRVDAEPDGDVDTIPMLSRRTLNTLSILARLHTLGTGTEDLVPGSDEVWSLIGDHDDLSTLSDAGIVLSRGLCYPK